jgi:hypothetical protein
VTSRDDLRALESFASVWGFELERCSTDMVQRSYDLAAAGSEAVLAIGASAEEEARVYAHLTGRELVRAEGPGTTELAREVTVVITREEHLSPELLDAMFPAVPFAGPPGVSTGRGMPGLIYAPSAAQLRRRCLCCAVTAVLPCQDRRVTYYLPTAPEGVRASGLKTTAGRETSATEAQRLLSSGAGLLALMTHSNGIDARLSAGVTLCSVKGREVLGSNAVPNCVATSHCRVLNAPLDQALGGDRLWAPTLVRCGVLFWYACHGLLPAKGCLDVHWGLVRLIWLTAPIGAMMTSLANLALFDAEILSGLGDDVRAGADIGSSLARHLARGAHLGNRFCLLGDPRAALAVESAPDAPELAVAVRSPRKPFCSWLGRVALLRTYFQGLENVHEPAQLERAITLLARFEKVAWMPPHLVTRATPELNAEVARAVAYSLPVSWLNNWLRYTDLHQGQVTTADTCRACGRTATTIRCHVAIPGSTPRVLTRCWHCQATDDFPLGFSATFRARDGVATLDGVEGASPQWSATLRVFGGCTHLRRVSWPADEASNPCRELATEEPWPPGDISISLIFAFDADVAVMTRIVRGSPCERARCRG